MALGIQPHIQSGTSGLGYLNPFNYDVGATELAAKIFNVPTNTQGGSTLSQTIAGVPQTQASGQVLGATTSAPYSTPTTRTTSQPTPKTTPTGSPTTTTNNDQNIDNLTNNQNDAINNQRQQELDAINAEYASEQNRLNSLEGQVNERYGQTKSQVEQYFPQFQQLTEQQKAGDLGSLQDTENSRKLESASALNKARALLADLQRRQQAYMSATGNYSSSAADAFAEQFGRQANSSLSDVQSSRDQSLREIDTQRQKVNTFYNDKLLTAKQSYDQQLNDLLTQFNAQRDQIANARSASSAAKSQAAVQAWQNYTNAKLQLDNQLFQYQNQYSQWKQQMDAQLGQQAQLADVSGINQNFGDLQGMVSGVGVQPATTASRTTGYTLPTKNYDETQSALEQLRNVDSGNWMNQYRQ